MNVYDIIQTYLVDGFKCTKCVFIQSKRRLILNRSEAGEHDYTWFPDTSNLEITGKRLWAILKYYVNVFKYIVLSLKYFN